MAKHYTDSLQRYGLPEFRKDWATIHRGIEKESLRVSPEGHISLTPHPAALGSALTNPFITTDFSEALLEFITPVCEAIDDCLSDLENIHRFTLQHLEEEEILWVASMPCPCPEEPIPIAQYGSSNIGRMKTLYRHGLSHRYGSVMQVIAGLHYNFSMPESFWAPFQEIRGFECSEQDFRTHSYLHLIRNFHRYSWLLIYLFGASPAACRCFAEGREHNLEMLDAHSLYLPKATCLRMGNLGYRSDAQKSLFVCYNELETYVSCLHNAIHTPYPPYEEIGQKRDGEYLQMNTNLLQLENEFYSTIRPKPKLEPGQRPLDALVNTGIEYVEVRALDLNPYLPLGIDAEEIRFLDSFLLHCLLADSPACDEHEYFEVNKNLGKVVEQGRDPDLLLSENSKPRAMREWAEALLEDMEHSVAILDHLQGSDEHGSSLLAQQAKVRDSALTPSGRMLDDMAAGQMSFFEFSMQQSRRHGEHLKNGGLNAATLGRLQQASQESLAEQKRIEAADTVDFDDYLAEWNKR